MIKRVARGMRMDPYKVLGIERESSQDIVKKAYFRLAKLHHPDLNSGNEVIFMQEMFKKVNEAYSQLKNLTFEAKIESEPEDMLWNKAWQGFSQETLEKDSIYTQKKPSQRNYQEVLLIL